jgi:hypothetical protein
MAMDKTRPHLGAVPIILPKTVQMKGAMYFEKKKLPLFCVEYINITKTSVF